MTADSKAYGELGLRLLPPGRAWTRAPGSVLRGLLEGFGFEFARTDKRSEDLLRESDPRETVEMLGDWERSLGLPDPCTGPLPTAEQRRSAIVARLIESAGQSPAFFVQVALALGFEVEVVEYRPAVVDEPPVVDEAVIGDTLADFTDWAFTWDVVAENLEVTWATVDNASIGDPLAVWGNDLLECTLTRLKPAHTLLRFRYNGVLKPAAVELVAIAPAIAPPFLMGEDEE
jgi:uncharacterized protein YmfQ (DUF2313 family)